MLTGEELDIALDSLGGAVGGFIQEFCIGDEEPREYEEALDNVTSHIAALAERGTRMEALLREIDWFLEYRAMETSGGAEEAEGIQKRIRALLEPPTPKTPTDLYREFAEGMQELADTQAEHLAIERILRPEPLGDAGYSITQKIDGPDEFSESITQRQAEYLKELEGNDRMMRECIERRLRGD